MNIPYLVKILGTTKLSELIENIDLPPIDINLAIWDAEKAGQIKTDRKKDKIKLLVEPEISFDADLANKLLRTMQHYWANEINTTRGLLNSVVKQPMSNNGYPWQDYLMSLQYLIDSGQVKEIEVSVPKTKDRPYHNFVFLCLEENPNEDWNTREVNKWIANFNSKK